MFKQRVKKENICNSSQVYRRIRKLVFRVKVSHLHAGYHKRLRHKAVDLGRPGVHIRVYSLFIMDKRDFYAGLLNSFRQRLHSFSGKHFYK